MTVRTMVWSTLRDKATDAFASMPPARDEATLLEAFQRNPVAVERELAMVVDRFKAGKVTAPWRIWALNCSTRGDARVPVGPSVQELETRAAQWIRTAGCHCDRWGEVEDELFGDRGRLRKFTDVGLRDRLRAVWEECRPAVEDLELDAVVRGRSWRETHDLVRRAA